MTTAAEPSRGAAAEALHRGQHFEARGDFPAALACYAEAIAAITALAPHDDEARRLLGVALMNRGNALQKIATPAGCADATRAYDEAIAQFETLPLATTPAFRNHLGAAWLNRGHALLGTVHAASATGSFERAAALLESLPLDHEVCYRLNLAGARTNLAHALLATDPIRARNLARAALALLAAHEREHPALSEMSLRARRALVMANGELLRHGPTQPDLANEATDAIDDGLALARDLEARGNSSLRPLARRLFRLGAQIYRLHQPHFLAEFLLEIFAVDAFARDPDFRSAAQETLALALAELRRPRQLVAGEAASERFLETARALRAAHHHLFPTVPHLSTHAA